MTGIFSSKGRGIVLAVVVNLVSLSLLSAATLFGQRSDKATVITFTSPVEIPGSNPQVLPPGTYMFKLVDSKSTPHIVQVSNKEESKVYSTIMALPAHRDASTRDTVITFEERGGGHPQAIQTWFYPNDINGEEFVYSGVAPIAVAAAVTPLAPANNTPVNRSEILAPVPPAVDTPPLVAQTSPRPQPAPQEAAAPPPQAPQPAQPAQPAPPAAPAPAVQEQQPQAQPQLLPHTASNLPLLFLVGVLFVGSGLTLRRFSQG